MSFENKPLEKNVITEKIDSVKQNKFQNILNFPTLKKIYYYRF